MKKQKIILIYILFLSAIVISGVFIYKNNKINNQTGKHKEKEQLKKINKLDLQETTKKEIDKTIEENNLNKKEDTLEFIWPTESQKISTGYIIGKHEGLDIIPQEENIKENVKSIEKGTILETGFDNKDGYFIKIEHANDYISIYKHLDEIILKKDTKIERGEIIGKMGISGHTTGVMVHLDILKENKNINPLDILK